MNINNNDIIIFATTYEFIKGTRPYVAKHVVTRSTYGFAPRTSVLFSVEPIMLYFAQGKNIPDHYIFVDVWL